MPDLSRSGAQHASSRALVLETLPLGVMIADRSGRYVEVNAAASRILGYSREILLSGGLPEPHAKMLAEDGSILQPDEAPGVIVLRTGKAVHRKVVGMVQQDGDTLWLDVSAEPWPDGGVLVSFDDITRQHLTESILAARARIAEMAATATLEEILRATLDEVERLTGSCIGFYHFMDADQRSLTLQAWSTRTQDEFCKAIGRGMHYSLDQAGVWADAARTRRPSIHNDFVNLPDQKGMPEGRATLHREVVVPVLRGNQLMALVGVGNKPFPYGNRDLQTVLRLADLAWDIVERKRSEEIILESESQLHRVVMESPFPVMVHAEDGEILQLSRCWSEITGYSPEDLRTMEDWAMRAFGMGFGSVISEVKTFFDTDAPRHERDYIIRIRSGEQRHWRFNSTPTGRLRDGRKLATTMAVDLTERNRISAALTASEAQAKIMLHTAMDGVWLVDEHGQFQEVNEAGCRMLGYSRDELVGMPVADVETLENHEEVLAHIGKVMDRGWDRFETRLCRKDGSEFPVEISVTHQPEQQQLVIFARDITERKRIDLALLHNERQYRGLFDSMKEGFALHEILTDGDGHPIDYRFLDVNPAFVAMTGLPRDRWIGLTVREIFPGIEPRWIREYGQVALSGHPITFEDDSRDLDRCFRVTAYRPAPRQFAVLMTDITEIKRTELERKQLEQQIARTQKMESLGSLAGGVAHDMNNVLGAIMGLASIHQEQAPDGSRLHKSMDTILKACTRGRTLVKGLLGFARQGLEEVRVLDLNEVIREEVALLERTIPASVHVETDLNPNLRLIHGDPASLSHVLMNLCVNAIDAMPEGGRLKFRTCNKNPDMVSLEVADTGCGMAPDVLEKALDPFFTTKGQGKGTGLGLAIVYGAVKAHHGQLEIASAPGEGTRILMHFPATTAVAAPGPSTPRRFRKGRPMDILVVDDDELIQDSLAELLRSMGHRPTLAPSGEEALRLLAQGLAVDVVLLDLNMPGLGGAGTLPLLRAAHPDLPVLLATGRADQSAMDLVARTAKTILLPKPFSTEEIANHFRQLGLD